MPKPIRIAILGDSRSALRSLNKTEGALSKLQRSSSKATKMLAVGAAAAGAAVVGVGVAAVKMAGEAEQNLSGAEAVFGRYAATIKKTGAGAYKTLGLSQSAFLASANKIGSLFQGSGLSVKKSLAMTTQAMQRAGDVASVMGVDTSEAMRAIEGAAKGNFTMMDNLGVAMNATSIEAYALAKGMNFKWNTASNAQKTEVAMRMFMDRTSKYAGNFEKETRTSFAGAVAKLKAQGENLFTAVGVKLLPVLTRLTTWVTDNAVPALEQFWPILSGKVAGAVDRVKAAFEKIRPLLETVFGFFRDNPEVLRNVAIALGVVAAALVAVNIAFGVLAVVTSPITLVVLAIAGLVAAVTLAWKHCETFRTIVKAAFTAIRTVVAAVLPPVKAIVIGVFNAIKTYFTTVFAIYKTLFTTAWNVIKTVTSGAFKGVKTLIVKPLGEVVSFIAAVPGKIVALGGKFLHAGRSIIGKLVDGLKNAGGFVSGIAGNIWNAVKGMINTAIDKINGALEFTIKVPAAPDIHINAPNIPHLANGGITTGPTLALIGDNPGGREAVIPLDKYNLGGPQKIELDLRLSADQVDQLTRGKAIHADLAAYTKAGGR